MDAEEDGEGACRQQFFAELFFVLKRRMIFSEVLPQVAIDVTGDGGLINFARNSILQCQDFERFRYIHSSPIEKDLFVIYAVDTVRGCKHPIVANLQDFVSFSKRYIRNILRKRYCKANKVDQFAHHIFPPEFRCIWNPRECFPLLVVLQQSKGTQIPREENEGERG